MSQKRVLFFSLPLTWKGPKGGIYYLAPSANQQIRENEFKRTVRKGIIISRLEQNYTRQYFKDIAKDPIKIFHFFAVRHACMLQDQLDNAQMSVKGIMDALRAMKIVVDDNPQCCPKSAVLQNKVHKRDEERINIWIFEQDENNSLAETGFVRGLHSEGACRRTESLDRIRKFLGDDHEARSEGAQGEGGEQTDGDQLLRPPEGSVQGNPVLVSSPKRIKKVAIREGGTPGLELALRQRSVPESLPKGKQSSNRDDQGDRDRADAGTETKTINEEEIF